jgi:hypothetical protein
MKNVVEDKEKGCLIRSDGFQVEIQPDEKGGVFVLFFGKVPRRLKYVVDKHKDLFVNVGMARTLVCNEISGM